MDQATLKCLIIEDEPIAAEVIKDYVEQVGFLELRGICTDAIYALEKMRQEPIDVIFLDIHLPRIKGLDFLKSLQQKPQTILTTAYHEYALNAFDEDVVDYLMKPIEFSRFLKAVNRLARPAATPLPKIGAGETRDFHVFNVNRQMVKVYNNEILYVESLKDYCKIVTINKDDSDSKIVTRGQIGELDDLLKEQGFLRIHRSFLVNLAHVRVYSASDITVGNTVLPVGRSFKEKVAAMLQAYFKL